MKRVFVFAIFLLFALSLFAAPVLKRRARLGCACVKAEAGIVVQQIMPKTSAEKAGLKRGDILLAADGMTLTQPADLSTLMRKKRVGDELVLDMVRDGDKKTLRVPLLEFERATSDSVDVFYEAVSVNDSLRRVIITKPKGEQKSPTVEMLADRGCFSVDVPTDYRMPLAELCRELGLAGFVTVRVEKSGMGDSQGPPCLDVDLENELAGYRAALRSLPSYSFVDTSRVFLLGHGSGGILATELSKQFPVKGIVALETIGGSWFDFELESFKREQELTGVRGDSLQQKLRAKDLSLKLLLVERKPLPEILRAHPELNEYYSYPVNYTHTQQLSNINISQAWEAVRCPVFVLWGTADYVTSRDDNFGVAKIVNGAHPNQATFAEVANLDHDLRKMNSPEESFAHPTDGTERDALHPHLRGLIVTWLEAQKSR